MELFTREHGVVNVHLTSGEDIIAYISSGNATDTQLLLEKPTVPQVRPNNTGGMSVALVAFRPWLNELEKVSIPRSSVTFVVPVDEQMATLYRQVTSVIDVVPASAMPTGAANTVIKL